MMCVCYVAECVVRAGAYPLMHANWRLKRSPAGSISARSIVAKSKFMAFDIKAFVARWPYAYHLTSRSNVASIRSTGRLENASTLLIRAGLEHLLGERRTGPTKLRVNGLEVWLREQYALRTGNVVLSSNSQCGDL